MWDIEAMPVPFGITVQAAHCCSAIVATTRQPLWQRKHTAIAEITRRLTRAFPAMLADTELAAWRQRPFGRKVRLARPPGDPGSVRRIQLGSWAG
jgi:hypothetical protein